MNGPVPVLSFAEAFARTAPKPDSAPLIAAVRAAMDGHAEPAVFTPAGVAPIADLIDLMACDLEADVLPELSEIAARVQMPIRSLADEFLTRRILARRDGRLFCQARERGR